MIVKSKGHKFSKGLFYFLAEYIHSDKGKANDQNSWSYFHNITSRNPTNISQEFSENDRFRKKRKNGVAVHHIILAFSPKDREKLTPEILNDLVSKMIELRGNDALYFGRLHTSDEHPHIHLMMSANKYDSPDSVHMTRPEFDRFKKDLEAYQIKKYPELKFSVVHRQKDIEIDKSIKDATNYIEHSQARNKAEIKSLVNKLFIQSKHSAEFYHLLEKQGLTVFKRNGKISGIITPNGKKYRFSTLGIEKEKIQELDKEHITFSSHINTDYIHNR